MYLVVSEIIKKKHLLLLLRQFILPKKHRAAESEAQISLADIEYIFFNSCDVCKILFSVSLVILFLFHIILLVCITINYQQFAKFEISANLMLISCYMRFPV